MSTRATIRSLLRAIRRTHLPTVLFLLAVPCLAQQNPSPDAKPATPAPAAAAKAPAEASKLANPIKSSPASIAAGKKEYGYDCAMCHGADGGGKGDLAVDMKLKIGDYRDPATLKSVSDGDMFEVIKNGKGEMPSEVGRLKDEQIWNLVNYIRTFPKNSPAPEATKDKPDSP